MQEFHSKQQAVGSPGNPHGCQALLLPCHLVVDGDCMKKCGMQSGIWSSMTGMPCCGLSYNRRVQHAMVKYDKVWLVFGASG